MITPDTKVVIDAVVNGIASIRIDGEAVSTDDIKISWYRRGEIKPSYNLLPASETVEQHYEKLYKATNNYLLEDFNEQAKYIYYLLREKPHLDSIFSSTVNKLIILDNAEKFGLTVPEWAVLTSKKQLNKFKNKHNSLITKSVVGTGFYLAADTFILSYTEEMVNEFISHLPDYFPASFFQKKVEKEFEIRSYLLDNKFYSMAIFSQQNEKTAIDFRKYDEERPNRNVPFKLPAEQEEKLLNLAKKFKMDSCSFDLIYGKDEQYYFLEVNPVGQFGMTSFPCNYHIEKRIAKYLAEVPEPIS